MMSDSREGPRYSGASLNLAPDTGRRKCRASLLTAYHDVIRAGVRDGGSDVCARLAPSGKFSSKLGLSRSRVRDDGHARSESVIARRQRCGCK